MRARHSSSINTSSRRGACMMSPRRRPAQGPLPEIAHAWVERSDGNVSEPGIPDEFARCAANLRQAAAQYFNREQLLLTNYNKAKHGAPIIRTPALATDEFFVLAPQRDPTQS